MIAEDQAGSLFATSLKVRLVSRLTRVAFGLSSMGIDNGTTVAPLGVAVHRSS